MLNRENLSYKVENVKLTDEGEIGADIDITDDDGTGDPWTFQLKVLIERSHRGDPDVVIDPKHVEEFVDKYASKLDPKNDAKTISQLLMEAALLRHIDDAVVKKTLRWEPLDMTHPDFSKDHTKLLSNDYIQDYKISYFDIYDSEVKKSEAHVHFVDNPFKLTDIVFEDPKLEDYFEEFYYGIDTELEQRWEEMKSKDRITVDQSEDLEDEEDRDWEYTR